MEYWRFKNEDGTVRGVESHSYPHKVPGAKKVSKKTYDAFIKTLSIERPGPTLEERITTLEVWIANQ